MQFHIITLFKICFFFFFASSSKTGGGPGDRSEQGNGFVCTTCRQLFYTERGLNSHMCFYSEEWQSPSGKEKLQVKGNRDFGK